MFHRDQPPLGRPNWWAFGDSCARPLRLLQPCPPPPPRQNGAATPQLRGHLHQAADLARWRHCGKRGSPCRPRRTPARPATQGTAPATCDRRAHRARRHGWAAGLTSPHTAPSLMANEVQPAHWLVRPHGPRRPVAPPAQGGHIRSSAPTWSFGSRASAADRCPRLLVRLSAEAGLQHRPISGSAPPWVPLTMPPSPANQDTVTIATAWRQGRRLTSTEPTRGAPKRGLEKEWGGCATPNKERGDTKKGPLTTPKCKTAEEKGGENPHTFV
uniref:Uncharacterized protein n=1 Tax=Molossus molossus TaxID=27622 RepID=A0A7J8C8G8_MOLMO|nr:hypothetical protein HJG59_009848 [Molossus molossus]